MKNNNLRWIITGLYVGLIYSTLGVTRMLTKPIRELGILRTSTACLIGVVLLCYLFAGRGRKNLLLYLRRCTVAALFILIGIYLTHSPEERMHLIQYGILGGLIGWSLQAERLSLLRLIPGIALIWLIGFGDEIIQYLLPSRVYDIRDIIINGLSGSLGLAGYIEYTKTKKTGKPTSHLD